MKILAVADRVAELVYGPNIRKHFGDVDLVLSCGDLPYHYLEYIVTMLAVPVFFVRGNHDREWEQTPSGIEPAYPGGCVDLHCRVAEYRGLLLAGLQGSMRYKPGPYQCSEREMALNALQLWPGLWWNRARTGRFLDILVSHAPPRGIHDQADLCHRGFVSLLRFMDRFRPRYLVHGHVHLYGCEQRWRSSYRQTEVVNAFGYRVIEVSAPGGAG
ncbi:MAG: metallophosphoesterase [Anaerolineae bacterium]|nr:metallophosphoesterase [Anaerolineae bacterium]